MATTRAVLGAVGVLVVGLSGTAEAANVTYSFTAVDGAGVEVAGRFDYPAGIGAIIVDHRARTSEVDYRGGGGLELTYAGYHFLLVRPFVIYDVIVGDDTASGDFTSVSAIYQRFPGVPPEITFSVGLGDSTGTVFSNYLDRPEVLDLARFDRRTFRFNYPGLPRFQGTITSLEVDPTGPVVPEPSSVVLAGLGAVGVGLAAWRRRASAKSA